MKQNLLAVAVACAAFVLAGCEDKATVELTTPAQKASYGIGLNMGRSLSEEGMDDLEECLLLFPEVDHDDLFDALDFAMTMADGGNEIRVLKREDFRI